MTGIQNIVELRSERGIDYTKLRNLLAAGEWREADQETARVMCKAVGREEKGWLREVDVDSFPCVDLRTINQLWLHYSDGKFGFSVQKEIYQRLKGTREDNEEVWNNFGDRVGWREGGKWQHYSYLTFDKSASEGHLPVYLWGLADAEYVETQRWLDWGIHGCGWAISSLAQRL